MIKTLRITVIVTAIVAAVFFVLSGVFGLRHDTGKEAFLANPSVTSLFKKDSANKQNAEADIPLVTQAQVFALRINPPKPVEQVSTVAQKPVETPKFRLLGTSVYPDDPNRSMALIDEPGKGVHWVVPSDKIGHLTVTQVADGKVVYTDGQKTMEMTAEKPQKVSQITVIPVKEAVVVPVVTPEPAPAPAPAVAAEAPAAPAEPEAAAVESPPSAEVSTTPEQIKDNIEFVKKLMADPNSAGVNAAEANELKDLGEFLKQLENEQAQSQADANLPQEEPNVPNTDSEKRHSE
jgi:hypothetical protein